jgi:hypothetical protein
MNMTVRPIEPFIKEEGREYINPFLQNFSLMGTQIGKNVFVMFEKFEDEIHKFIDVVDTKTGERVRIKFD